MNPSERYQQLLEERAKTLARIHDLTSYMKELVIQLEVNLRQDQDNDASSLN